MFLVEAKPGQGAPLHFHDYDEVVIVQEGNSRFVIGDEIHDGVAGNILVVKARTPHGFINSGEGLLNQIDIHVSPRFKQQLLEPTEASRKAKLPLPR
jgi:mannose-6-phosphate isomerase-like protein (cupin superfamily)